MASSPGGELGGQLAEERPRVERLACGPNQARCLIKLGVGAVVAHQLEPWRGRPNFQGTALPPLATLEGFAAGLPSHLLSQGIPILGTHTRWGQGQERPF